MIRAVLDVNVLLSSILGPFGFCRQIVLAWEAVRLRVVASDGIASTLEEQLNLPRIVRRYNVETPEDIRHLQDLLRTQAELIIIPVQERLSVTGDPEDDVLATGRLAQAEYLVTGDRRLLELGAYAGTQIVSPRAFFELLEQRQR